MSPFRVLNPCGPAVADLAAKGRAQRRLVLAAALLGADRSMGGLGLKFGASVDPASVLSAIKALPAEVADHFKGLVNWVESYEYGEQTPVRVSRSAAVVVGSKGIAHASVSHAREAPVMEDEGAGDEEDSIHFAMASIRDLDSPGG